MEEEVQRRDWKREKQKLNTWRSRTSGNPLVKGLSAAREELDQRCDQEEADSTYRFIGKKGGKTSRSPCSEEGSFSGGLSGRPNAEREKQKLTKNRQTDDEGQEPSSTNPKRNQAGE